MDRIGQETTARISTVLTWVLAVMLIVALAGVVYVSVTPGAEEDPYTEFYILGPDGNASDYPTNLSTGETGEFIVGITNNEHQSMTYTVVLMLDDDLVVERTVEVDNGETWEGDFRFVPEEAGVRQLDILLYIGEDPELNDKAYLTLELNVDVSETDQAGGITGSSLRLPYSVRSSRLPFVEHRAIYLDRLSSGLLPGELL
jgi:uncharacterized membrane protein